MKMIATILGSGTSMGVPPIGCEEAACLSDDPKNKRLRAGLWLREAGPEPARARGLIVDCGPDYRQQALTHRIHRLNGLLITHAHFDHVSGLDDLRIYNFRQGQPLPMRARPDVLTDVRKRMDYIFDPPQLGGGVASFDMQPIEGPFEFLGMRILPVPVKHGILDILGFRFGDFGFVTDASAIPPESMEMLKGVRVLILNALRHKPHSTHFSLDEAVAAAREIGAERTWFVHMTHHLEHHATNALLPKGIELAYEGLQFEFQPDWTGEPFGGQP
jgi:phosphoribosyl 1,2-cyclic phosphate phosphodiesterase